MKPATDLDFCSCGEDITGEVMASPYNEELFLCEDCYTEELARYKGLTN